MDGAGSTGKAGTPRPDLPIWERTPRAVPPPLGAPPPVAARRAVGVGSASAARVRVSQGTHTAMATEPPRTPWGVKPVGSAVPGRIPIAQPVGSVGPRRLSRGIAAGVALALVAIAATVVVMRSGTSAGAPTTQPSRSTDQSPVREALANLSGQPMLRYSGLSPHGRSTWELTVTSGGEAQGALDLGDGKLGVLEVGGRTYFKAVDTASVALLGQLPSGLAADAVRGKWVAGDSFLEALLPSGLASAGNLAASLQSALPSQDVSFPSTDLTVRVNTSAGVLYVSNSQPYRVLRLVPSAAEPGQPTDIETVSQSTAIYSALVDQTKTLTSALDFGIVFEYSQGPKLYCSDSQCTVEVGGVVASAADSDPPVADMTAKVTVDGQPAGTCEVVAKLPPDSPANLTCQDPDAASVVQSLKGEGGLGVDVAIQFLARADTQAEVDSCVAAEQKEEGTAGGDRTPSAPGGDGDQTPSASGGYVLS
jgi:hypothetical protein